GHEGRHQSGRAKQPPQHEVLRKNLAERSPRPDLTSRIGRWRTDGFVARRGAPARASRLRAKASDRPSHVTGPGLGSSVSKALGRSLVNPPKKPSGPPSAESRSPDTTRRGVWRSLIAGGRGEVREHPALLILYLFALGTPVLLWREAPTIV